MGSCLRLCSSTLNRQPCMQAAAYLELVSQFAAGLGCAPFASSSCPPWLSSSLLSQREHRLQLLPTCWRHIAHPLEWSATFAPQMLWNWPKPLKLACYRMGAAVCPFMIYGEIVQRWRLAQGAVLRKWPRAHGQQCCLSAFPCFVLDASSEAQPWQPASASVIWKGAAGCVLCCTRYLRSSLPLPS